MILLPFILITTAGDKPVIRLDEVIIEGKVRRPAIVEIEASHLQEKVEEIALSHLIRLEKELLKPARPEDLAK